MQIDPKKDPAEIIIWGISTAEAREIMDAIMDVMARKPRSCITTSHGRTQEQINALQSNRFEMMFSNVESV